MDEIFIRAWIASVPGIGPKTFLLLQDLLPNVSLLHTASQKDLLSLGISKRLVTSIIDHRSVHSPEEIQEWCEKEHVSLLLPPSLLSQIPDPPIVLYCKGKLPDQTHPHIAVVGTRKITPYGKQVTEILTKELVQCGCVIVSGFMYGVDSVAHTAAMKAGGKTIGVLGFGLSYMYPSEHRTLARQMIETGNCLLSEFPPWQSPIPGNFPQRNRIVSGLSLGVLVTEAAQKSGSLITAACAVEQGREVFAVPGSINSPFSSGTKDLINMGATLVTNGRDIIEELALQIVNTAHATSTPEQPLFSELEESILTFLQTQSGVTIEELIQYTACDIRQLTQTLSNMELAGHIEVVQSGVYILRK